MDILGLILLALSVAVATYMLATFVSIRLGLILWLAISLFGVSLLVNPIETTVHDGTIGRPINDLAGVVAFLTIAAPATIGSTLGLITAWIVKRMRETAV